MTHFGPHKLVALVVRLFAVALAIFFLRTLSGTIMWYGGLDVLQAILIVVLELVIPLFFIIFLWKFPLFIATKLLGPREGVEADLSHESLDTDSAYALGFIILGFYLLFWGVSDSVYWLSRWVFIQSTVDPFEVAPPLPPEDKALMLSTGVEFLMALVLILGSKWLARLVKRVRYGALS